MTCGVQHFKSIKLIAAQSRGGYIRPRPGDKIGHKTLLGHWPERHTVSETEGVKGSLEDMLRLAENCPAPVVLALKMTGIWAKPPGAKVTCVNDNPMSGTARKLMHSCC